MGEDPPDVEWSCLRNRSHQEAFASHATHANAALTPRARLRLARLIVDQGWPVPRAAERYDVSWRTAKKWAERYRAEGQRGWWTGPRGHTGSRTGHRPRWSARSCTCAGSSAWGPVEIADKL